MVYVLVILRDIKIPFVRKLTHLHAPGNRRSCIVGLAGSYPTQYTFSIPGCELVLDNWVPFTPTSCQPAPKAKKITSQASLP